MNEIITITKASINNEEVNAVNARDLWEKIESKRRFGDWIKDRLEGFTEGQDYVIHKIVKTGNGASGKQYQIDYIISLDTAKHIAMLERNEQGHKIRQYFIEVEKNARKIADAVNTQIAAMIPVIRENERLRFQLDFARHFLPQGKPGELNEQGVPKTQFRRGYYTSGKGKSVTALIERYDQPGLFDEVELERIG